MPRRVSLPGAAELFRQTQERIDRPEQPWVEDRIGDQHPDTSCAQHPAGSTDSEEPGGADDRNVARREDDNADAGESATAHPVQPSGDVADPGPDTGPSPEGQPYAGRHDPGEETPRRRRTGGSGRVKHAEKITVYVSNDELLGLEQARLALRADHGMAVDRGRIVREALALVLGDLSDNGADSQLVHRLSRP